MAYLPSLRPHATVLDVFKLRPRHAKELLEFHEVLLRGDSELTEQERELIAAYVSGLNDCGFCHGVHAAVAEHFGAQSGLPARLVEDLELAEAPARLRPILRYVRKLTEAPSSVTAADAQAVLDAGWSEAALLDALYVCALYNFMNRLVEGAGIVGSERTNRAIAKGLHRSGYLALVEQLGLAESASASAGSAG